MGNDDQTKKKNKEYECTRNFLKSFKSLLILFGKHYFAVNSPIEAIPLKRNVLLMLILIVK